MLVTGGGEEAEQIRAFPCTRRAVAAPCLSSPSLAASDVSAPFQHCAGAVRHFLSMEAVDGNDNRGELDIEMPTLQGTAPVVTSGPAVAFLMGRWSREVHLGGSIRGQDFAGKQVLWVTRARHALLPPVLSQQTSDSQRAFRKTTPTW